MTAKFIGEAIGYLATAVGIAIYLCRKRKTLLVLKAFCDGLWAVSFLVLGGFSGAAVNAVSAVRDVVFTEKGKNKWLSSPLVAVFFITVNVVMTLLFNYFGDGALFPSWYSVLPPIGSAFSAIALFASDEHKIRLITIPSVTLWIVYAAFVHSTSSVISGIFSAVSLAVGLYMDYAGKKKSADMQTNI